MQDERRIVETRKGIVNLIEHEFLLNGVEQWVSTNKMPLIDQDGNCIGTFGISKDVTYIKKLEIEAQRQAGELRHRELELKTKEEEQRLLNQQKIKFFSVFSHDIKNPLHSLSGFVQLLSDNYDNYDDVKRKKILSNLNKITENFQALIINLLDWSRSQLNNISINKESLNIQDILKEITELYTFQQNQKYISVFTNVAPDVEVIADKYIVQTVFRNLYSNALKFSHPGGKIEITATKGDSELFVRFTDNGIGMSRTEVDKLFALGDSVSRMGTLNEKGTGLGLIVSQEFLHRCNGHITVESTVDEGSVFTVRLPLG